MPHRPPAPPRGRRGPRRRAARLRGQRLPRPAAAVAGAGAARQPRRRRATTRPPTPPRPPSPRRHGAARDEVLATAGAAEAFTLLARAAAVAPTGGRAPAVHRAARRPRAGRAHGHRGACCAQPFTLDPAAVPDDADLVVLGNPTNPTGVLHPAEALRALLRPGRLVVVDEAFMDTVPGEAESLSPATPGLPGDPQPDQALVDPGRARRLRRSVTRRRDRRPAPRAVAVVGRRRPPPPRSGRAPPSGRAPSRSAAPRRSRAGAAS